MGASIACRSVLREDSELVADCKPDGDAGDGKTSSGLDTSLGSNAESSIGKLHGGPHRGPEAVETRTDVPAPQEGGGGFGGLEGGARGSQARARRKSYIYEQPPLSPGEIEAVVRNFAVHDKDDEASSEAAVTNT